MMIKMYNLIGETKKYLFTLLFILLACPVFGQVDNEVRDDDDSDEPDSAMVDSLLNDSVARPWPQGVQHRLAQLLESDMFETSQVGMMVYDLDADSAIFKYNERQLMRPASTMKVITAITAMDQLGGDYQFKTEQIGEHTSELQSRQYLVCRLLLE